MDSSKADYILIEAEADRVAKQAAKSLKQTRSLANRALSGIPTWTGQSGGSNKWVKFVFFITIKIWLSDYYQLVTLLHVL